MSRCLVRDLNPSLISLLVALLLVGSSFAQEPRQSTPNQTASSSREQKAEPNASKSDADQSDQSDTDKPSTDNSSTSQPQTKITPAQAEQLFHDVDTILDFASNDTSLPKKHDVKRRLASREEEVSYLKLNMAEDKDVQRLRRTELVLKKFGLLPKDFDLQTFLVSLLEEQVAGYYDAKTKTVNLLDWVLPDLQRPGLAHELTHALQDQSFGLDKWLKKGNEDLDTKRDLKAADITKDENSEARQAVTEGQAMVVLMDYMLAPMHRTVANSPEVVQMMNDSMANGSADSKIYQNAPVFMKEALTFPYRYGVEFETEVLRQQGKGKTLQSTL